MNMRWIALGLVGVVLQVNVACAMQPLESTAFGERLKSHGETVVGRACGRLAFPWGVRGERGSAFALHGVDRTQPPPGWRERFDAALLRTVPLLDHDGHLEGEQHCDGADHWPAFMLELSGGERAMDVVVDFQSRCALVYERSGKIAILDVDAQADVLWSLFGELFPSTGAAFAGPSAPPRDARSRELEDTTGTTRIPRPVS